jgi:NitT/TauT family transport system permease protein
MAMERLRRVFLTSLVFGTVLAIWGAISSWSNSCPDAFPGPWRVLAAMGELMQDGTLLKHTIASLFRVTLGYYLAILLALPLGILLGWWKPAQMACNAFIQFLRPISPLAWIPLTMLWFGIGDKPAIFLIFLSSFFPLLVSTIVAVNHIRPMYLQVAANFNLSPIETFTRIIFPAILPSILPALRISMGIAWLVVVAAEMIAVKSGLGFLILDSRNALRLDYVMDAMAVIGVIGIGLDKVISQLGRIKSVSWGMH